MLIYNTEVKKSWIDHNNHMNVAFYYSAFEAAMVRVGESVGMNAKYLSARGLECQIMEGHIQFILEAYLEESLQIESEIFYAGRDGLLVGQQMFREAILLCRFGQWNVTVSRNTGLVCALEDEIFDKAKLLSAGDVEPPDWLARQISMTKAS